MVGSIVPAQVAIGACLNCRQLFLITPDSETCYLCGRLPAYRLAFPQAAQHEPVVPGLSPEELPPAGLPILIGITCPHCHANVQLSISDSEISVVPPPAPEPQDEETLPQLPEHPSEVVLLPYAEYPRDPHPSAGAEPEPPAAADDRTTVLSP